MRTRYFDNKKNLQRYLLKNQNKTRNNKHSVGTKIDTALY